MEKGTGYRTYLPIRYVENKKRSRERMDSKIRVYGKFRMNKGTGYRNYLPIT